jgi:hypothetical protein
MEIKSFGSGDGYGWGDGTGYGSNGIGKCY